VPDSPFSSEHRERFRELLKTGELFALNSHDEYRASGPWHVSSDIRDSEIALSLKTRFRAAVMKAAFSADVPFRVNRMDWWISGLVRGKRRLSVHRLIQRSAEYCEVLEARSLELGPPRTRSAEGGLYRDRYPCDWGEPYLLYDQPHAKFPDSRSEFEYWHEHIWRGFNDEIGLIGQLYRPRRRQEMETRMRYRERVKKRVELQYPFMKASIRGLSYDLAVLQANYIIDRGLRGDDAAQAFRVESAPLVEDVRTFMRESSKRLGLSYKKQEKEGPDVSIPFQHVGEDMLRLTTVKPLEALAEEEIPQGEGQRPTHQISRSDADDASEVNCDGEAMDLSDLSPSALKLIAEAKVEARFIRRKAETGSLFGLPSLSSIFELGELEREPDEISTGRNEAALHLFHSTAEQLWARVQPDLDAFKARLDAAMKWVDGEFHPGAGVLKKAAADERKRARRDVASGKISATPRPRVGTGALHAGFVSRQQALKEGRLEGYLDSQVGAKTLAPHPQLGLAAAASARISELVAKAAKTNQKSPLGKGGRPVILVDGERIRELRGEHSQAAFARLCKISEDAIQRAERRGRSSETTIRKILNRARRQGQKLEAKDLIKYPPQ
jgi:hypothetical protein